MEESMMVIEKEPPRNLSRYQGRIDFYRGLRPNFFSGSIFTALGMLAIIGVIIGPHETGPIIFKSTCAVVLLFIGYRYFRKAVVGRRERVAAFYGGRLFVGTVVGHGRSFVTWKSGRDYIIAVQVRLEDGKVLEKSVRSPSKRLHELHPLQAEIDVLVDLPSGSIFIPDEVGIRASFQQGD